MATPKVPPGPVPSDEFDDEGDTQVHEAPFDDEERTQSAADVPLPKLRPTEAPNEASETLSEDE